jgi:tRNA pseudouridine(55) synthase
MKVLPYIVLDKKRGETPLEAVHKWKEVHPEYIDVRAAYAGRLDPMAEGKLLVLLGEECKNLTAYTKLDKEYEIEVLLDSSTDTGDVLGLATYADVESNPERAAVRRALSAELGTHPRAYPIYSSKTVHGKPLFLYALEGTLDTITVPEHDESFYTIKLVEQSVLSKQQLQERINSALAVVPRSDEPSKVLGADFRQDAVRARWESVLAYVSDRSFAILKLRVTCGSGAYMRTLADRIGKSLGTRGLALSIRRTRIGKYTSVGFVGFWTKQF